MTTVTGKMTPLVIVVRFHPTTPAVRVPPPVAETKLVPAGMASDRLSPVASVVLLFLPVRMSILFPYTTLFRSESDLVSARLAEVLTVVSSVAVLSEVSGSNTPEVVLAVLEMLVVREESTLTTRVTDLLAPLVRSEERRVGKEARCGRAPEPERKQGPGG